MEYLFCLIVSYCWKVDNENSMFIKTNFKEVLIMGFLDTLGKVAVSIGEEYEKKNNEFKYWKGEYSSCDNNELKDVARNTTGMKREAAIAVLKERGLIRS